MRISDWSSDVCSSDLCFIGARSEVVEGVIVETGAVLSMGVFLSKSTRIVNRETGEISMGRVPAYSVVVPGRSEEHTSELQSLMRISYAVFCLKKINEIK